jgi:hypothetical protein
MSCDHERLKKSPEAFDEGTRPVIRDGVQARQCGARLADCITCPPGHVSTFMHPGDVRMVEEYLDREDAQHEAAAVG